MSWLLLLHISAMICWCGALIYLPILIAHTASQTISLSEECVAQLPRALFNYILTPAAVITILSGTLIFIVHKTIVSWLIIKLTLVIGLVVCHTFNGWLILRMENKSLKQLHRLCLVDALLSITLITIIISVVLGKLNMGISI